MTENQTLRKIGRFHNKNYKKLLLIPLIVILLSVAYMIYFYNVNGDFILKDISLTGGTSITISEKINSDELVAALSESLDDLSTKELYDLITREQTGIIIETKTSSEDAKNILEEYLNYKLTDENSSVEFTGAALSESFYKQLLIAILIAFVFMAIVVFIIFRTFVPSAAVIISAFADIFMTLTLVNLLGIKMSTAGIVAFLMLIGYSVDTDILLTTRLLKRKENSVNERMYGAFKTGITMTLTSLLAFTIALIIVSSFSIVLSQIFTILVIGLTFDIFNTWITNASILRWYQESKQ